MNRNNSISIAQSKSKEGKHAESKANMKITATSDQIFRIVGSTETIITRNLTNIHEN